MIIKTKSGIDKVILKHHEQHNTNSGFTLMELMISILIISGISMGIMNIIPLAFANNQRTVDVSKASELAQKYIEILKVDLSDLSTYDLVAEGTTPPIPITEEITANGYFDVTTSVSFVGSIGYEDSLMEISIMFNMSDTDPLVYFSTIIPKPDPRL